VRSENISTFNFRNDGVMSDITSEDIQGVLSLELSLHVCALQSARWLAFHVKLLA
jgi:hypothetical protein